MFALDMKQNQGNYTGRSLPKRRKEPIACRPRQTGRGHNQRSDSQVPGQGGRREGLHGGDPEKTGTGREQHRYPGGTASGDSFLGGRL